MGLISGMLGNAGEIDARETAEEFSALLGAGEEVSRAYRLVRDTLIFTDKRLILVDVQGVTGRKVEYHSIPYGKIRHFSVETTGSFDLDAELKIWLGGGEPITKRFNRKVDIYEVQAVLASFTVGS